MTITGRFIASHTASRIVLGFLVLFSPGVFSQGKKPETCFSCHGKAGTSTTALTPSLGGQPSFFTVAQLFLFRDGRRGKSPSAMDAYAKPLSDADLQSLAAVFEKQPPPQPPAQARDPERFEKGRRLIEARNCRVCHNPDYSGREQMPRLGNQREDYLLKAMRDYQSGQRIGYGSATMPEELAGLGDADLAAIAHFLAHLPRPAKR
ncbi:MAG TPA: c-type cytochrome [Burkholderiales bacterium]